MPSTKPTGFMPQPVFASISRASSRPRSPAPQISTRRARLLCSDRGVRHRRGTTTGCRDRQQQQHRIDDEHAARKSLEPIQICGGQHRRGACRTTTARTHGGDVADAEREPRAPVQSRRIVRRELAHEHDRQRRREGREKDLERLALEAQSIGRVVAGRDQHEIERAPAPRASGAASRARRALNGTRCKRGEVARPGRSARSAR